MNIEQQRAACARFKGWELVENFCTAQGWAKSPCYWSAENKGYVIFPSDYHPDLPESIDQANGLKKRLRELGYHYRISFVATATKPYFMCRLKCPWLNNWTYEMSNVSEEATLVAAVAKLQYQSEKADD